MLDEIIDGATTETERKDEEAPKTPDYVEMTLASGVSPLEIRYAQINSAYRKLPIAYRSFTFLNSVVEGVVPPEKYSYAADVTDRGIRLAKWNVEHAIRAIRKFKEAGRDVQFVTARCPAKLAAEVDMYEWMKSIIDEYDFKLPEQLCLEFPQSLLFEDSEKVRLSLLNMKLLKVKTMMAGCGADDCPMSKLIETPVDMVMLDPMLTRYIDHRSKGTAVTSLISYVRSMNIDVIGDGVYNDAQITALNRADCLGYIHSSGYKGNVEHGSLRMKLDDAVAQKDEAF